MGRRQWGCVRAQGVLLAALVGLSAFAQSGPAAVGQWSAVQRWPEPAVHTVLMGNGKVLWWTEQTVDKVRVWDPKTGTQSVLPIPGYNPFCAGHSLLEDGKVLVTGGHIDANNGEPKASIFDPQTNSWTRLPDMNAGRWYPTQTPLPDGNVLVVGGIADGDSNPLPQVWDVKLKAWRSLTSAVLEVATYPFMFLAPNGKVFCAGSEAPSRYLDTAGTGKWTEVASSAEEDREAGSAVMYADGKVMMSGGADPPTNLVEVIDLNLPKPLWRKVAPMARPRRQHTMTLLPDGKVLVTGGSCGVGKSNEACAALQPELWDPATEKFSPMAPSTVFRGYHSTALLLPDGRVMSAGGEKTGSAEFFSPPYLFKGARPQVTYAPPAVGYAQTFTVQTPDAQKVAQVTLLRPGAVTHAFNQGQRIHKLAFTAAQGELTVTAPPGPTVAPAGPMMLFLVNQDGVPSVASWVRLQTGTVTQPNPPTPPVPPKLTVTAPNGDEQLRAGATFELRWTTQGAVPSVALDWSSDLGKSWDRIAAKLANDGGYSWAVPFKDTTLGLVRVSGLPLDGGVTDQSDLPFAVRLGVCEACDQGQKCQDGMLCLADRCRPACGPPDAGNPCVCQTGLSGSACACPGELAVEGEGCQPEGSGEFPVCQPGLRCEQKTCQAPVPVSTVAPEPSLADPALEPPAEEPPAPAAPEPKPDGQGCASVTGPGLAALLASLWGLWARRRRPGKG